MPRGTDRYDEARFQRQLWTPAHAPVRPYAWLDAANRSSLTVDSSGNCTAFAQGIAKSGGSAAGTGTVAYQPKGWIDGASPCFFSSNNATGFQLTTPMAYSGSPGMSAFFLGNVAGTGTAGYFAWLSGTSNGCPFSRYRDDSVVDVVRANQLGLVATPALTCSPGAHPVGFDAATNSVRIWLDGYIQATTTTDPAFSQPAAAIAYDPTSPLGGNDRFVECLLYDQKVPDWMCFRILAYLAWKWRVNSTFRAQNWAASGNPNLLIPPLIGV